MNFINKLIWGCANPFIVWVMLLGIAFVVLFTRRKKMGLVLFGIAMVWGWIWSTNVCFKRFNAWWELSVGRPQKAEDLPNADAILDLGGGMGGNLDRSIYPDMNASADREWHSARLWKAGKAPVVIPSGRGADLHSKPLLLDMGVPENCIIRENEAVNTEENAKKIQALLKKMNADKKKHPRVLLVTSAWHMRRSVLMFQKYAPELIVIPAAIDYENYNGDTPFISWRNFIPSIDVFGANSRLMHEVLGYYGYKWFRK